MYLLIPVLTFPFNNNHPPISNFNLPLTYSFLSKMLFFFQTAYSFPNLLKLIPAYSTRNQLIPLLLSSPTFVFHFWTSRTSSNLSCRLKRTPFCSIKFFVYLFCLWDKKIHFFLLSFFHSLI